MTTEQNFLEEPHDFSLVVGGPIFQLFRNLISLEMDWNSCTAECSLLHWSHGCRCCSLPFLVRRLGTSVESRSFMTQDLPLFGKAIGSAIRLRNSISIEVALILLVYTVGLWLWHTRARPDTSTWYFMPGGSWNLTPGGFWYVFVSIPIVQFLLLRWYLRLFIWFRFLWQVSRIKLHLIPTHPDRSAGLAFVGKSAYAFGPILFAQGAMLAGLVASRVLYRGESLLSFKLQIGGFIVFFVFAILGPLLMFTPQKALAKRKGLADYGLLAQRYVESFEQKWVHRDPSTPEELLGAADIQSLAELQLPSCLSYSQFSRQKNSLCASSRSCFEDAGRYHYLDSSTSRWFRFWIGRLS